MADQRQTVRDDGSIGVHGRSSLDLVVSIRDGSGQPVDVTGRSYFFEVAGLFRVPLQAVDQSSLRVLLTRDQVELIGPVRREFALIDETEQPLVIWSSTIQQIGFKGAPA